MKTLVSFLLSASCLFNSFIASAQTKTEKISVSGECGMCKSSIEKAAKSAGASYTDWDSETKALTVKFNTTSTSTAKIEKAVATVGYDTKNIKATDEAYNKLHECCKYERAITTGSKQCTNHDECKKAGCIKKNNCDSDGACCKTETGELKACCKKA